MENILCQNAKHVLRDLLRKDLSSRACEVWENTDSLFQIRYYGFGIITIGFYKGSLLSTNTLPNGSERTYEKFLRHSSAIHWGQGEEHLCYICSAAHD